VVAIKRPSQLLLVIVLFMQDSCKIACYSCYWRQFIGYYGRKMR